MTASLTEMIDCAVVVEGSQQTDILLKAKENTENDPGAPFEEDVIQALAEIRQQSVAEYLRYRQAFKRANRDVLLGELDRLVKYECGDQGGNDPESIADLVVNMVTEKAELFTCENDESYADFESEGHSEVWLLQSTGFREWVSYIFYSEYGKAPRDASLKDAISSLAGIAKHEGGTYPVYLRCAPNPNGTGYIIDSCDETWSVIEVTPTGWRKLEKSPVKFKRTKTMKPLPDPVSGGSLSDMFQFANIPPESRNLVISWVLESFRPDTPFPVLEIGGEQGSAKSSTQSRLRDFIDPSGINLRAAPKTDEDVFVSAGCNWLASYNNLSHLSASRQDALCTLATGGGYGGRKLYTNDEEAVWESKRPVVINGISTLVTAPDLLDRTIRIDSPKIENYISEKELQTAFEEKAPGIFGALLDLFGKSLAIFPEVHIDKPPRMTDFAYFGEAVYQALGEEPGTFLMDYQVGRKAAIMQSIESSPVANAIVDLATSQEFRGTVGTLLQRLEDYRPKGDSGWPKSAKGLSDIIKRFSPALRMIGVLVSFEVRSNRGRQVHISFLKGSVETMDTTITNSTNVTNKDKSDGCDGRDGEIPRLDTPPERHIPDEHVSNEGLVI